MKFLRKLTVVVDRGNYSIDGKSVGCGEDVSYGAGRVVLEKTADDESGAPNLRIAYYEGISEEPRVSGEFDANGVYHFDLKDGVRWFQERPERLKRLLSILNIPDGILSQHEKMQILVQKGNLKTKDWRDSKNPTIRAYYREASGRPMIDRLFLLNSVNEIEFAHFLSYFLFGVELGVDYFDALDEGPEAAHAWVASNVIVEVGHSHYGTPISRRTYLMMADARDKHHSIHETKFRPSEPRTETGHAKAVELLGQHHGYRAVLEGNILDMLGEEPDPATDQLAYFDAWEDVKKAAALLNLVCKPIAVERRGKTLPHLLLRDPLPLSCREANEQADYIGGMDHIGIPQNPESMIYYGHGEYVDPLFKRHGMELLALLNASIPHTRRISAPQLWRHYESMKPEAGLVQGSYSFRDFGDQQDTVVCQAIRPVHEMCEFSPTQLSEKGRCLTSPDVTTVADDAVFAGFLTDASQAHILTGEESAVKNSVLWLPKGRSFSYLGVVKQNFREDRGLSPTKCDVALWGFTVTRDETGLHVAPYEPPRKYALYYSEYSGFYVYDALPEDMPRFVKEKRVA